MLRKDRTDTKETKKEKQRKTKGRLQVSTNIIENNNLYDAWTISTHDACSNAVRISSIWLWNHKIGLSIEFISKTPNFENPLSETSTIWSIDHYTRYITEYNDQITTQQANFITLSSIEQNLNSGSFKP